MEYSMYQLLCLTFAESIIMVGSTNSEEATLSYYTNGSLLITYVKEHMPEKDTLLLSEIIDTAMPLMQAAEDKADDFLTQLGTRLHISVLMMLRSNAGNTDLLQELKNSNNVPPLFEDFIEDLDFDEED